jgi:methylenetetrahydrofolate reductase (NADPH)
MLRPGMTFLTDGLATTKVLHSVTKAHGQLAPWYVLACPFLTPSSLSCLQKGNSLSQWGDPKTNDDLTQIFLDYLHSTIATTPFSPGPLSPESLMILPHLKELTRRGWWTVGSQPAIDSAKSTDPVVGWGPRSGYVFQKSFVEFFCNEHDVDIVEKRVLVKGKGRVHWFATNSQV